ncbi:GAF domain-containing protein [Saccharopolyspora tripterygii]
MPTHGIRSNAQISTLREQFLARPLADHSGVRGIISASWRRALEHDIDADEPDPLFVPDRDEESLLVRSATPVLENLATELAQQPVAILLTDADGLVVHRSSADRTLDAGLDSICLAPGYSYAEDSIGTNGIGTTLECQEPVLVSGFEHFKSRLAQFECAGTPIFHPVRGHLVGVLDLTSWQGTPGPLLLTLARRTANQIEDAILAGIGSRELALFREYLSACKGVGGRSRGERRRRDGQQPCPGPLRRRRPGNADHPHGRHRRIAQARHDPGRPALGRGRAHRVPAGPLRHGARRRRVPREEPDRRAAGAPP